MESVESGGTLVHAPRRHTGKIFKSSRFGSVTTGYDTLLKFLLWLSVSNCVSFPCVVYFCLFSPLKDRYAFSICLQLLGASPPDPTGALPLYPAGGLPSPMWGIHPPYGGYGWRFILPSPHVLPPPLANFWLRPCME